MSQVTMNRYENNANQEQRNPFQRNGRSNNSRNNRSNGSGGYQSWKQKGGDPYNRYSKPLETKPKEKVLTADDFPALPGLGAAKPKGVWGQKQKDDDDTDSVNDVTLADRVKEVIAKEEAARARGHLEEENNEPLYSIPIPDWIRNSYQNKRQQEQRMRFATTEEFREETVSHLPVTVVPLSDWIRKSHLAKKQEEEWKRRAWEAEEANYRWQISPEMFPPKVDPPMPEYDDELEEDEQNFQDGHQEMEEVRD